MDTFRLYKILDKLQDRETAKMAKIIDTRIQELRKLRSADPVEPKTLRWREKQLVEVFDNLKKDLSPLVRELFELVYKETRLDVLDVLGERPSGLPTIHKKAINVLNQSGLTHMYNYTNQMVTEARELLYAAILTGESYDQTFERAIKVIPQNGIRRIDFMVRDQTARIMQYSTFFTYQENKDLIRYLDWSGPSDDRTTEWCKNRKRLNPWTLNQVEELIQKNPKTYKKLKIRDPNPKLNMSFLHPHIQCRHRFVVTSQRRAKAINKTSK